MRKLPVLLFIVCLAMTAHAQFRNAHYLNVNGSALSGNISNGSYMFYEVRPTSSGTLVVETTGNIDTYMFAYDSSGWQIAYDDDGGQGSNARITLNVSANQTYYFGVTGYGDWISGSFNITAVMGGRATEINIGHTFSGSIQDGETQLYRVRFGNDPWYQISWDDRDRQHFGTLYDAADIRVGIRREDSSSYLIEVSDIGDYNGNFDSYYSNQHRVYNSSSPRFDSNTWYIIEVEAFSWGGGNFRLFVE